MLCVTDVYLSAHLFFPCIGQKVNWRLLNSMDHHKADATLTIPGLSSTAIWSFGMQAVCAIGQFLWFLVPLLFGFATSEKSSFDQ